MRTSDSKSLNNITLKWHCQIRCAPKEMPINFVLHGLPIAATATATKTIPITTTARKLVCWTAGNLRHSQYYPMHKSQKEQLLRQCFSTLFAFYIAHTLHKSMVSPNPPE